MQTINFFSLAVAEDLISTKRIKGSISGGRQASIATYIPEIYSRSQNEYCDNFLKQNGYLGNTDRI